MSLSAQSDQALRVARAGLQDHDLAPLTLAPLSVVYPGALQFAPPAVFMPAAELVPSLLNRASATRYRHGHEGLVHSRWIGGAIVIIIGVAGVSSSARRISRFEYGSVTGRSGKLFGHLDRRFCREDREENFRMTDTDRDSRTPQ